MGFAAPAIVGATAAKPGSRVYAIIGDGAFQMTGTELSTCAKYNMKPIVCILNNDGYGTQRKIIDGPFNDIHRWEYAVPSDEFELWQINESSTPRASLAAGPARSREGRRDVSHRSDHPPRQRQRPDEALRRCARKIARSG